MSHFSAYSFIDVSKSAIDIILMQLGIGQEIFPITHYQLPITSLHRL
ncbi:hypothetical protein [Fischerella thermalis]